MEKKINSSILKDPQKQTHHFHINKAIAIRLVKRNQLSFSSIENPSPQCLIDQIQVQKPIQIFATDQMPDHT